jgi:chorismate mutase/prephenate dehydratase
MSSSKKAGALTPAKSAAAVKQLRNQIDRLDLQILKLLNERAEHAAEIGEYKADQGADTFAPAREEEVIQNLVEHNRGPLDANTIRAIYRDLISGARALQKVLKVAYLGPEYSFSHVAALERFGNSIEYVSVGSIAAVFEEVNRGHADYGVVPLENSTDGRIADTLDMFMRLPEIKICAEIRLKIHHNLLANCTQSELARVYSKPQALSQCRNWLSKNVPHAKLVEVTSTAVAAELAQRERDPDGRPRAAAVASRQAAVRYGLRILFENIEDYPNNETRFAIIGLRVGERSKRDKTALMFEVSHEPGELVDALAIFKNNKINLTWIESFPSKSGPKQEYVFFVDFEGHVEDAKVKRAIESLNRKATKVVVLGSFPWSEAIE